MPAKTHLKLGDLLIKEGIITESQLREGMNLQKASAKRLGEALVDLGYMTEKQLVQVLSRQLGLPFRSFSDGELTPAFAGVTFVKPSHIPFPICRSPTESTGSSFSRGIPAGCTPIGSSSLRRSLEDGPGWGARPAALR